MNKEDFHLFSPLSAFSILARINFLFIIYHLLEFALLETQVNSCFAREQADSFARNLLKKKVIYFLFYI